jgi:hypothetical protein
MYLSVKIRGGLNTVSANITAVNLHLTVKETSTAKIWNFSEHDTQHNVMQSSYTQHNNKKRNTQLNGTRYIMQSGTKKPHVLRVVRLNVVAPTFKSFF